MAYYERGYYRDPTDTGFGRGGGFGGGGLGGGGAFGAMKMWSVNTWIILMNIAVFVLDGLFAAWVGTVAVELGGSMRIEAGPLWAFGYFSAETALEGGQLWRLVTFQFLHAGLGHIFFNMLALFFFGRLVESYLGSRRYLAFYLLTGVAGPCAYITFWQVGVLQTFAYTPLVGASAGVFGVLVGAAAVAPNTTVMLLFPPIPLKLRTLAWVLVGIGAFTVLTGGGNAGGEAAHLGGAAAGFLLIRNSRFLDFARRVSIGGGDGPGRDGPSLKKRYENKVADHKRKRDEDLNREVDRILAKVHEQGLASLTEKEKRVLRDATQSKRVG